MCSTSTRRSRLGFGRGCRFPSRESCPSRSYRADRVETSNSGSLRAGQAEDHAGVARARCYELSSRPAWGLQCRGFLVVLTPPLALGCGELAHVLEAEALRFDRKRLAVPSELELSVQISRPEGPEIQAPFRLTEFRASHKRLAWGGSPMLQRPLVAQESHRSAATQITMHWICRRKLGPTRGRSRPTPPQT